MLTQAYSQQMNSANARRSSPSETDATQHAVAHLFDELRGAVADRASANDRVSRFADTIRLLLRSLPTSDQRYYEELLGQIVSEEKPAPRGGEAFGKIIQLFRSHRSRTFTIAEVQAALGDSTIPDKAIYNAIAYLASSGRLKRVSRGAYVASDGGFGVDLDGDRDDGTARVTEHDS